MCVLHVHAALMFMHISLLHCFLLILSSLLLQCVWRAVIDRSCVFQCIWLQHRADGQSSGQDGHPDRGSTRILRPSRWERTTEVCVISPESVCVSSLTLLCCSSSLGSRREALHRCWRYVARQSHSPMTWLWCFTVIISCVVSLQLAWLMKTTGGIWESCSLTSTKSRLKVRP